VPIILLTLNGCVEADGGGLNGKNTDTGFNTDMSLQSSHAPFINNGTSDAATGSNTEDISYSWRPSSITIENVGEGSNFKDEILKHISASKTAIKGDEYYSIYERNNISEIKKFYFPPIEIDGYIIERVELYDAEFGFYYIPVDETKRNQNEYMFLFDIGIILYIRKPEFINDSSDPLKQFKNRLDEEKINYLTEDNWIYVKCDNELRMQIGNTWLMIRMPEILNNFEYLRGLCNELNETIELVSVE